MSPEQWLNKVAQAIENRARGDCKTFHVGWGAGGVACLPRRGELPPDPIFGTFTDYQLERGLTRRQWDQLKEKITEYLEDKTK